MSLKRCATIIGIIPFLLATQGCVDVSMHSMRHAVLTVTDKETGLPSRRVPVRIYYSYDSFTPLGPTFMFRQPKNVETETDDGGHAYVELADYKLAISLLAGSTQFSLNKQLVRKGGAVRGRFLDRRYPGYPEMELHIAPFE